MRSFTVLAALLGAAMAAPFSVHLPRELDVVSEGFTVATPGTVEDVIVTEENTLNATALDTGKTRIIIPRAATKASLPIKLVNNFDGGAVKAYIQGLDSDGHIVFIGAKGQLVYPSAKGSKVPVEIKEDLSIPLPAKGQTLDFTLPISLSSGRIYFAAGNLKFFMVSTDNGDGLVQPSIANLQDPSAGINWGFVEFTYTNNVLYANISYVDFVGMVLGMKLQVKDGSTQSALGLAGGAVTKICNDMQTQKNSDGRNWTGMCIADQSGKPIRVISPTIYNDIKASDFSTYWDNYVNQVWSTYTSKPLTIDTQMSAGKVKCQVKNNQMTCAGDNRAYNKPNAKDIWGCNSGPFGRIDSDNAVHVAIIPRLCSAFVRSTLLLAGGDVQPSLGQSEYYKVNPTNHYSKLIHKYEPDGKGYAFSYDDVNPSGKENASGTVASGNVQYLAFTIGAPN